MRRELPDVPAGFRKGRGTRDQVAKIHWIIEKQENSRKTYISASLTTLKTLTCGSQQRLKILKEMGTLDNLTCLLKNLYTSEEAAIRTGHGTIDCFKIGKGVCQGCILSPCLFNLYAEYIKRKCLWQKAKKN